MKAAESIETTIARVRLVVFDFDGVFTDNTVYVAEDGTESVRCWRGDGLGLARLREAGIPAVVLSTERNPVVASRSRKLNVRCIHGCDDKLSALRALAAELGVALFDVAYVGNDVNDLACLEAVGLPIVVRDAHPDVAGAALLRTTAEGGRGAVREICDRLVSARARAGRMPAGAGADPQAG
ncbi:MAG: HAD hydrolase family protein [Acidobacteria bacterium]|nr:HAD hydrolase family protein [Acidobacteriota bacterium]